ncbi:hypothetical protein MMC09_002077 [Bachmanniomyces sp. S44760]|nr:hypothetical protein [Bachmanniomyces sp. S44760]
MSIPNSMHEDPPPALPPPRHLEDLAAGNDPGWLWGNKIKRSGEFGSKGSGTVSPNSSLRGGSWDTSIETRSSPERPQVVRRDSSTSTIKSTKDTEMYDAFRHGDEGYHSLSGSSLAYQLQGERPLERRNLHDSSQAYDKSLLSRIGKPKSPPRASTSGSVEASPSKATFFQAKHLPGPLKNLSTPDRSMSTSSDSPFSAEAPYNRSWVTSPQSAVVSPGLISSAVSAKSYLDSRSHSVDIKPLQSGVDADRNARSRQENRRFGSSGSILTNFDDASSVTSRSNRGAYDHAIFADPDSDFPIEETGGMRQLHLDDRSTPSADVYSPDSRPGMKRKALSPPREASNEEVAPPHAGSEFGQRRTSGHLSANRASPVHRYHPDHGSVSSTSSSTGLQNNSYASSAGLSVGGSSVTSISSHERLSPGGISPGSTEQSKLRDSPYVNSVSLDPKSHNAALRQHQRTPSDGKSAAAIARKMSSDNTGRGKQLGAPKISSNLYMCECCPKKPKKFDTPEELHNHQMEKQYICSFCHNRFKNKNEAERHQNSLHLRRHSWSCANLGGDYGAAFHDASAIPPTTGGTNPPPPPGPGPYLVCGYCGERFPNDHDWDTRIAHLTNVHKFAECNQGKKFFRADHFRQHLKHSHAGTSGKWTNMLENACMKEEPPITPEAQSQQQQQHQLQQQQQYHQQQMQQQGAPVAPMMGGGQYPPPPGVGMGMGMGVGPGSNGLYQERIDEVKDEM